MSRSFYLTLNYHIQILNEPIRSRVYRPRTQRYQVIDLIWLRYHVHLTVFGYGKELMTAVWFRDPLLMSSATHLPFDVYI